jgi:hypothetical protein
MGNLRVVASGTVAPIEDDDRPSPHRRLIYDTCLLSLPGRPHMPNPRWWETSACPFGTPREGVGTGLSIIELGSKNDRLLNECAGVIQKTRRPLNYYWVAKESSKLCIG